MIDRVSASNRTDKDAVSRECQRISHIFDILSKNTPQPTTELVYRNPFTLLIAVILSAQSTDKGVNRVTPNLFDRADNPVDMARIKQEELESLIARLGLFRNKAKNIIACSRQLVEKHKGLVPDTRIELEALSGVGRKTANVILNTVYGKSTIAVDTHVFRVSRRLGISVGETPNAVERDLEAKVPDSFKFHAHHWLILLGRYTCVARRPKCAVCPVASYCPSADGVIVKPESDLKVSEPV